jgi:F0F1-type ATP synthase alpha subunit
LQQQTNSLSTGISTNWVYVTDGSVSSTNILVNPTRPAVFYRLTYP